MVLVDYIGISFYMWQYFWPHTVYTKYILVLSVINLFITPTFYLNFILLLCFNQKCYIFRQCTYSVSLSRYMWPSTLYTKFILVLSVMNLFIIRSTIYSNFILILSFNQKAIFMGSLMQWLYFGKDESVLSNQNTGYNFFDSFAY